MDMFWQFLGALVVGLSAINACKTYKTGSLFSAFAAGFCLAMGFIIIQKSLIW